MSQASPSPRSVAAVRILAAICVVLALICVSLAWAWTHEREVAACWRTATTFQQFPIDECGD